MSLESFCLSGAQNEGIEEEGGGYLRQEEAVLDRLRLTRRSLRALCRQLREMPSLAQLRAWRNQSLAALDDYLLSGQHIGNAFWGFKNMDSRTAEVLEALDLLALKTRESVAVMDGQNFANALYALHAMDGEKPAVRAALTALAHKLVATNRPFSGLDIGDYFPWLCLEYRRYG